MGSVSAPTAISFAAYQPNASVGYMNMVFQITDSTGTTVGSWPQLKPGWQNISIPLNSSGWLPAHNFTFPLKQVSFGANRVGDGSTGWLGFADIFLHTDSNDDVRAPMLVELIAPSPSTQGVLVTGQQQSTEVGLQLTNIIDTPCNSDVVVRARNSTGSMGESDGGWDGGWVTCGTVPQGGIPPWTAVNVTCSFDASTTPPSYFMVQAIYNGSSGECARVNDTLKVFESAVAIVPPRPPLVPVPYPGRNNNSNVFGGQMGFGDPTPQVYIGMHSIRDGALWRWAQPSECWNESTCFDWGDYNGPFALQAAGIDLMIDAREIAPPWAANTSLGPSWAEFPTPEHYADYQRYLTIMLDRYGSAAIAVEVSNEDDGLSYFQPQPIPLNETCIPLSLALINLTAAAMQASVNASGLPLMGLSSSMFDMKQEGNGGSTYAYYEKAILNSPGVMQTIDGASMHPYQNLVWVPWIIQWANTSFQFPNETESGMASNSTIGQLLAVAELMKEAAVNAGIVSDPSDYHPVLRPSEWGYALAIPQAAAVTGWVYIHAALVAQGLIHMRSAPVAPYVQKSYYFAAYDGCCEESNTFFGLWRPSQMRSGPNASIAPLDLQPSNLGATMPLPGVPAYAVASVLLDVPSGRAPGVFVVDHSVDGASAPAGQQLPPSCVAFEGPAGRDSSIRALRYPDEYPLSEHDNANVSSLAALMIIGHHYNDRTVANGSINVQVDIPCAGIPTTIGALIDNDVASSALRDGGLQLVNGFGSILNFNLTSAMIASVADDEACSGAADRTTVRVQVLALITFSIAPLPQYLLLPSGVTATSLCSSLTW